MRLKRNWRTVARKAWSTRLMLVAFVFTFAEAAVPAFADMLPPHMAGVITGLIVAAAFIARLVAQEGIDE
jgi:hypothetical protein